MDCGKAALLFGSLAFQMHTLSIAFDGYTVPGVTSDLQSRDDATKAFLILAFLCFLAAQVFLLLLNFGDFRGNKLVSFLVIIILLAAGVFVLIGIAVFGDSVGTNFIPPYSMTTYVVGGGSGITAAILLLLQMCCGCSSK